MFWPFRPIWGKYFISDQFGINPYKLYWYTYPLREGICACVQRTSLWTFTNIFTLVFFSDNCHVQSTCIILYASVVRLPPFTSMCFFALRRSYPGYKLIFAVEVNVFVSPATLSSLGSCEQNCGARVRPGWTDDRKGIIQMGPSCYPG